jgi:hypothetical protein
MCWHARHSNVHLVTIEFPVSLKRCKLYCVVIFQLKNASLYKKRDLPSLVNIRQAYFGSEVKGIKVRTVIKIRDNPRTKTWPREQTITTNNTK